MLREKEIRVPILGHLFLCHVPCTTWKRLDKYRKAGQWTGVFLGLFLKFVFVICVRFDFHVFRL